jgi:arylsulfatase A-like enzyme
MVLGERLCFLGMALVAGAVVAVPLYSVFSRLPLRLGSSRALGLTAGGLLALHVLLEFRLAWMNLSITSVRLWAPALGLGLLSLGLGALLDGPLQRLMPWAGRLALPLVVPVLWLGRLPPPTSTEGPNLLVITLDTTRPDRMDLYGGPVPMPNLGRLADGGLVFEEAVAPAPLTEASHLSLFTGLPVHQTGVVANGTDIGDRPELLHRRLGEAGFSTIGVVSGFPLHARFGWSRGFDVYDDDFGHNPGWHRLSLGRAWDQVFLPGRVLRERRGIDALDRVEVLLDEDSPLVQGRWFAWLHLFDPHGPYEVSEEALAQAPREGPALDLPAYWPPPHRSVTSAEWLVSAYDGELALVDGLLGRVWEALEASGQRDNTLVVVTADHGESLLEHDYLFDHGSHLYDASLRVPLVMAGPGVEGRGRVSCQLPLVDLAPALLAWAGLEEATALNSVLAGEACEERLAIATTVAARYVEDPPVDHALRTRDTKYILHESGADEFYDLAEDPGETQDQSGQALQEVELAGAALSALLSTGVTMEAQLVDEETLKALQALGYVE